eukprot:355746-Chlamydomonas_euryale.AAC.1
MGSAHGREPPCIAGEQQRRNVIATLLPPPCCLRVVDHESIGELCALRERGGEGCIHALSVLVGGHLPSLLPLPCKFTTCDKPRHALTAFAGLRGGSQGGSGNVHAHAHARTRPDHTDVKALTDDAGPH